MNNLSMTRHPFLCSLLVAVALCSAGAGCGQGDLDEYGSQLQGLGNYNTVGPIGTSGGTMEGPGTSNHETPIKKIIAYANSSVIYGLNVIWGTNNEKMYGQTYGLDAEELDFEDDPVKEVKYHVEAAGYLRGLRFKTVSGTVFTIGYLGGTQTIAFSHSTDRFTDLAVYKGTISGIVTIWGITLYYTGP